MFRKFKLVPIDDSEAQLDMQQVEKDLREYNPTARAMTNLYGGIQDALFSKKKKGPQKGPTTSQRLHLVAANRMRMEQLMRGNNEPPQRTNAAAVQQPEVHDDEKEMPMSHKTNVVNDADMEDNVKKVGEMKPVVLNVAIPQRQKEKFDKLAEIMSDTIGANRLGELVIRGETLRNTSYTDVMRALYVDPKSKLDGLDETVSELKRLQVDRNLVNSRFAKKQLSDAPDSKKVRHQKGSGSMLRKAHPRILRLY
jgi:hypothetical protein